MWESWYQFHIFLWILYNYKTWLIGDISSIRIQQNSSQNRLFLNPFLVEYNFISNLQSSLLVFLYLPLRQIILEKRCSKIYYDFQHKVLLSPSVQIAAFLDTSAATFFHLWVLVLNFRIQICLRAFISGTPQRKFIFCIDNLDTFNIFVLSYHNCKCLYTISILMFFVRCLDIELCKNWGCKHYRYRYCKHYCGRMRWGEDERKDETEEDGHIMGSFLSLLYSRTNLEFHQRKTYKHNYKSITIIT